MEPERKEEILKKLAEAVVEFDEDMAKEFSQIAIDEGLNAFEAIMYGMAAGMETVGNLYDQQEYFVPELLMAADAMYVGLDILKPHIRKEDVKNMGQVVIGTVQGDVHDIGKNIIKLMFEVGGFEVHDLGRDVPLEKFVEEQLKTD
ncbi:MAG: B12-binding domain-containing protein, partial [Candidatus Desulfatibia sp.]|uniref:B12-binding domain-containing protein n=1 Tax=Candidatus Desulfatibia sp. TaxID=3101189 RepID=UPI002F339BBF